MSARSKLTRRQEAVIAALLTERSHAAAATKAGVGTATVQRWLRLPEFQAAYRAARRQLVEAALGRLQKASGKAVRRLVELLQCGHPPTEARAAVSILTQAVRAVELADFDQRLDTLELSADQKRQGEGGRSEP